MENLDGVYDALEDIASDSSRNVKLYKLSEYVGEVPWLEETIIYALHPHRHYNINKLPKPNIDIKTVLREDFKSPGAIFQFLTILSTKKGAADCDKQFLSNLASISEKTRTVVLRILKKDLRCGISIKSARRFIKASDLPLYEVMKPYGDNPFPGKQWEKFVKLAGGTNNIMWATKVDGFRISYATVNDDGFVEYLSTNGKTYPNFKVFDKELLKLADTLHFNYKLKYPMIFDGECVPKDGDFQSMQKHARRLYNIDFEVYRMLVWDVVCDMPYHERYKMLNILRTTSGEKYDFLSFVSNTNEKVFLLEHNWLWPRSANKPQEIIDLTRRIISDGNEGIVLKTADHLHEFERSDHWFRIKALYLKGMGIEVDLPVIGFEYGREGTRMETMLGKFVCEYKGKRVKVSGKLSDKQRMAYVEDLPSVIEVHADSETNDGSLRLPIFQRVREDK